MHLPTLTARQPPDMPAIDVLGRHDLCLHSAMLEDLTPPQEPVLRWYPLPQVY